MKKKARTIEGFVPRRSNGPRPTLDVLDENIKTPVEGLKSNGSKKRLGHFAKKVAKNDDIDSDIMASLADLPGYDNLENTDFAEPAPVNKKALKKVKKAKKTGKKARKPLKVFLLALILLVALASAAFMALKYFWPEETLDGNFWEVFQQDKLQEDANGRSNIVIFGTEEDDYDGADLTDSIMVLSVNQTDHSAYMISLPRDLWVKHTCPPLGTTAGKLNETYFCALNSAKTNEDEAAAAVRAKVGEVLGLDIQYYTHLNWAGFRQIIDSVGGVDVTIESSDPRGIYDVNTGLKLANGPVHLNGEQALNLARARGAFGGYGLEGSNFAREANQQRIMRALQDKITGGAVSDLAQALSIIGALGDNLHTNFKASEVRALMDVAKAASSDNVVSLPLMDANSAIRLVTTDMIGAASVVVPTAGTFVYTAIHDYIRQAMSADPVVREAAVIDVLNGTDKPGVAQAKANDLKEKGYKIGTIGNAPTGSYGAVEIYQVSSTAKPGTAKALAELFGVEVHNVIPAGFDTANVDFIVVVGAVTE